ncbi:putative death-receptor fusion protein-domain-containing protein [Aspergillus cavernicola]|uniref:Death-receptor fusion protein-domain-containing protein n=1 Tax=Aspergillus cavernicola TaxID=176166 RepID=A0ABR4IC80_9EURO
MATKPVCSPQGDAGPIDMERISQDIQILPEETLDKIAKGPLVKFTLTCDDVEKSTRVFTSLLQTFASASLSFNHTTAACNALSAFLDAAFISQCHETRQLARSKETLVTVFDTFLTRFKDVKPRPMKQVLESVAVILAKSRHHPYRYAISTELVHAVLPSIILGEPRPRLKASIIALEALLRKNAIDSIELISLIERWLLRTSDWLTVLQEECRVSSIDISRFSQRSSETAASDNHSMATAAEILLLGLLNRSKAFELATSAGEAMAMFFKKLKLPTDFFTPSNKDQKSLALVWVKPVRQFLLQNLEILEKLSNYILQRLFTISPNGFQRFIGTLPLNTLLSGDMSSPSSDELTILFASLQVGKKIGLVHEDHYFSRSQADSAQEDSVLVLKSEFIGQFLFHHDFEIKMAALSLLITAPSTTKPVSSTAIRVIIKSLPSLHAESDPGTRGEILSLIRGLIVRLKGGVLANKENPVERKPSSNRKQPAVYARDDLETRARLKDYLDFLMADLRPTTSYHRHIMALKTIVLLLDSGIDERFSSDLSNKPEHRQIRWKFHLEIFGPRLMRLLVDLLLDPYDEVRATAINLLKLFPRSVLFNNVYCPASGRPNEKPELIAALYRAEQWASNTSRADHADTVARLYHVIFYTADLAEPGETAWWDTKLGVIEIVLRKLEDKLSSPEGLFNPSLRDAPLHGYLCALRYIVSSHNFYSLVSCEGCPGFENWKSIHTRISSICDRIWDEVKPQLCIDSPEGHAAEPIEDLTIGPKDILSYSWRALRESSMLLHATLSNETYGPEGEFGLTRNDFEKMGRTSFTQLAELRHRGAFSTVAQTFATCCQRCGQSDNAEISSLPLLWYQESKKIIFETASKLTRRSAGLPALMAGILLSNPGGQLFQQVIRELHDVAHVPAKQNIHNQSVELPQVHAMNCLREIFTNAKLGPHAEGFIMSTLNLSAERIGSSIWALRNAGLMLFRALMNRMCRNDFQGFGGKSGSEPGARVSFQKYPGLVELLSNLLVPPQKEDEPGQADTAMVTERVFPALELIAEKIPNAADTGDAMLLALIREHLKSPVWGIREHAARVYASLLDRSDILEEIQTLINARDAETQNYLHGESLCIRYALRRFAFTPSAFWNEHIGEVKSTIKAVFVASYPDARSPFVTTTLLEMLSDVVERSIESEAEAKIVELLDDVSDTYDILNTMDSVLDPSNPSWSTLNTTRAFSLLRRQLSWVTILRTLTNGDTKDLQPFLHKVATLDPNASQWLLERMHETFAVKDAYRQRLVSLYASIIIGDLPLEVKTPAILNLAYSLQVLLQSEDAALKAFDLPWGDLIKQTRIGSTKQGFNRDRADADVQLEGCLLALKYVSQHYQIQDIEISEWATRLRFALSEETEFTTRHAAATSIATFIQVHSPSGSPPRVDQMFLEIYLSLYDLLNDDDEELRDIGAATASCVLSYSSVSPRKTVMLSPMNASELFATFIAENYVDSQLLCTRAIRYILGQEARIGDSSCDKSLMAVSAIAAEFRKESTILFEEEKQNLFIEEVREVDVWSRVLTRLAKTTYDEHLLKEVFTWVSEGLTCFSDILAGENGEDGPIGWTAKPEAYTLGVRVISLASVMGSKEFSASGILGDGQTVLREKLQTLLERGKAAFLHDDLVSRIQVALEGL